MITTVLERVTMTFLATENRKRGKNAEVLEKGRRPIFGKPHLQSREELSCGVSRSLLLLQSCDRKMKEFEHKQHVEVLDDDEPPLLEATADEAIDGDKKGKSGVGHDNQLEKQEEEPSLMDEMVAIAQQAREEKRKLQEKARNSKSFGQGLKKGFFNTSKPRITSQTQKRSAVPPAAAAVTTDPQKKMPTVRLAVISPASREMLAADLVVAVLAGGIADRKATARSEKGP